MSYITINSETLNQQQIKNKLSENGMYLQFIDDITYDDCKKAVKENYNSFQFVPAHLQTAELCKMALLNTDLSMLKYIMNFNDMSIIDVCLDIIPQNSIKKLLNVYIKNPSEEICCNIVTHNPLYIKHLEYNQRTTKVCDIIIDSLDIYPELISEIPNFTTEMLIKVNDVNRSSVKHLDFNRYRIASLYDNDTKNLYELYPLAKIDSQKIESYVPLISQTNSQNIKNDNYAICYENLKDGSVHLINNTTDILNEIHIYIKTRYGNKNLEYVKKCMIEGKGFDFIQNDPTFNEGIFYQKLDNGKYELFKKTIVHQDDTWIFGSKHISKLSIEKIRIYSLIKI